MRTFTQTELNEILRKHKLWLKGEPEGERADLCWANLSDANLSGADLWRANLSGADLHRADLHRANLSGANLSLTDLSLTNLSGAYLSRADLFGANLSAADLSGANLSGANLSETIIGCPLVCPETGSFIGYKKVRGNRIVKLEIPEDAMRSSATTRKCRCSKAKVISITTLTGETSKLKVAHSKHDPNFTYTVGETVEVSDFDTNRWNECAPGIHFFMTREEAVAY